MRQWFIRLGFGKKIQLLMNLVSMGVLTIAIVVIGLGFYGEFKSNLEDRVLQKSNMLADASAVGVVFDQSESVSILIGSLAVDEGVKSAVVYKKQGSADYQYFAHYSRDKDVQIERAYQRGAVQEWRGGVFILRLPILVDNEEVGRLILTEENTYLADFALNSLFYMLPVLIVSMILVWFISRSVQGRLASPLSELTQAVHEVAYNQDYGKLVEIVSDDELGELGNAFNHMLAKLAQHEAFRVEKETEIIKLNAELEEKVFDRTKELKTRDRKSVV